MIEWNTVTWYSRWLAILLFILLLPMLTFYIGVQYQLAKDALVNQPAFPAVVVPTKSPMTSMGAMPMGSMPMNSGSTTASSTMTSTSTTATTSSSTVKATL